MYRLYNTMLMMMMMMTRLTSYDVTYASSSIHHLLRGLLSLVSCTSAPWRQINDLLPRLIQSACRKSRSIRIKKNIFRSSVDNAAQKCDSSLPSSLCLLTYLRPDFIPPSCPCSEKPTTFPTVNNSNWIEL